MTSDEEHPGVYGPLAEARRRGAEIVVAEFDRLADAVDVSTTAVVCSHVSWVSGALAPAELASVGVPVIYDGAQGVGAVPVDVKVLGCAAYAGSGQKWLCGPDGSGMLYVAPEFRERVPTLVAGYSTLAEPNAGLEVAALAGRARVGHARVVGGNVALRAHVTRGARRGRLERGPHPRGRAGRALRLDAGRSRPHGARREATQRSSRGSTTTRLPPMTGRVRPAS